jgi:cysteine-rich repeat protein
MIRKVDTVLDTIIFSFGDGSNSKAMELSISRVDNSLGFTVVNGPSSSERGTVRTARPVPLRLWVHLAVVHDVTTKGTSILVDGRSQGYSTKVPTPISKARRYHYVGAPLTSWAFSWFDGLVDDIRVWKSARTDFELRSLSTSTVTSANRPSSLELAFNMEAIDAGQSRGSPPLLKELSGTAGKEAAFFNCRGGGTSCMFPLSSPKTVCGDGRRAQGFEECDDGGTVSGDGCSSTCSLESGWLCLPGSPGGTDVCEQGAILTYLSLDSPSQLSSGWTLTSGTSKTWNNLAANVTGVSLSLGNGSVGITEGSRFDGGGGLRLWRAPLVEPNPIRTVNPDTPGAAAIRQAANSAGPYGDGAPATLPSKSLFQWWRADKAETANINGVPHATRLASLAPARSGAPKCTMVAYSSSDNRGPKVLSSTPWNYNHGGHATLQFTNDDEGMQISANEEGNLNLGTNGPCVLKHPYTVFAVTRFTTPNSMRIVSSQDNNWLLGNVDSVIGWHVDGAGWVRWNDGRPWYYYNRPDAMRLYISTAVSSTRTDGTLMKQLYRDHVLVAQMHPFNGANPSRLALGAGMRYQNKGEGELAELLVFNASLTANERWRVEQYLSQRYLHHSRPGLLAAVAAFDEDPSSLVSQASRYLFEVDMRRDAGNYAELLPTASGKKGLKAGTMDEVWLRFAARVQAPAERFGTPLIVALFEDFNGTTTDPVKSAEPRIEQCRPSFSSAPSTVRSVTSPEKYAVPSSIPNAVISPVLLCGGRRFYTICFNAGTGGGRLHCDETREPASGEWGQYMVDIGAKFHAKYGQNASTMSADGIAGGWAADGGVPRFIRLAFGVVSADDHPVEGWVDEVRVIKYKGRTNCDSAQVLAHPLESPVVAANPTLPSAHYRFRGGTPGSLSLPLEPHSAWHLSSALAPPANAFLQTGAETNILPGLTHPTDQDGAVRLDPVTSEFVRIPAFGGRIDVNEGLSVALWLQLSAYPTGGSVGSTDPMAGVVVWSDAAWQSAMSSATANSARAMLDTQWGTRCVLLANGSIAFSVNTDDGYTTLVTRTRVPLNKPFHLTGTWDPNFGLLVVYVDGIPLPMETLETFILESFVSGVRRTPSSPAVSPINLGVPRGITRDLYVGHDGIGAGATTLSGGMVVDELMLWNRALDPQEVMRIAVPYSYGYDATSQNSGAEVSIGGTSLWSQLPGGSSSTGLALFSLNPSTNQVIAAQSFPFDNPDPTIAKAAVTAIATFLNDSSKVPPGARVLGASRGPGLSAWEPPEKLLYVDDFSDRPDHSSLESRRYYRVDGFPYTPMTGTEFASSYPHTWAGAKAYCEDKGMRLCNFNTYCRETNFLAGTRTTVFGVVGGEGWTPYDNQDGSTNTWVAIGNAYSDRICKTYPEVFSTQATFSDTNPTSGGNILCCRRTLSEARWKQVIQVPDSVAQNRNLYPWNVDPYFRWDRAALRSGSWYVFTVYAGSPSYNTYYWHDNFDATRWDVGSRCDTMIWGLYAFLNVPRAFAWTDYTVSVRVYTQARDFGVLVRYVDDNNYYGYYSNPDPSAACAGIIRRRGPDHRTDWKTGAGIWRQPDSIGVRQNTWHDIRVSVQGSTNALIRVWVDNVLIISWTDDASNFIPAGTVAFWSAYNQPIFDNLRVYQGTPDLVDTALADSALRLVGGPPLPRVAEGSDFYVKPREQAGAIAFIGTKEAPQWEASSPFAGGAHPLGPAPYPPTTTLSASDAIRSAPVALQGLGVANPPLVWPGTFLGKENRYPAPVAAIGRSVASRDGTTKSRSLMACSTQTIRIPENSAAGTLASVPIRAHPGAASASGATVGQFSIVSGNAVSKNIVNPDDLSVTRVKTPNVFAIDSHDGTVRVVSGGATIDAEVQKKINLTVSASVRGYDSGWIPFHSMQSEGEEGSFREIVLPARYAHVDPSQLRVDVVFRAADGYNEGFVFRTKGSSSWDDNDNWWSYYGGAISAYATGSAVPRGDQAIDPRWLMDRGTGEDYSTPVTSGLRAPTDGFRNASAIPPGKVRLWAPTYGCFARGALINLGGAQGALFDSDRKYLGEKNVQLSHRAEARVFISEEENPDFDTGWIDIKAQRSAGTERLIRHGLDGFPDRVRVLVRAIDGPNAGMVFEAKGDGLSRDYYFDEYGGVVVTVTSSVVGVFPPTLYGGGVTRGYSVRVPPYGYGHGAYKQNSYSAEVRVLGWRMGLQAPPDWRSEWSSVEILQGDNGFVEVAVPATVTKGATPQRVEVWVRSREGTETIVPAVGMSENYRHVYWYATGGIVAAYSNSSVRLWAGSPDFDRDEFPTTEMRPMSTNDGWRWPDWAVVHSAIANVQVRVWMSQTPGQSDVADITVDLVDLQEPPIAKDFFFKVAENVGGSTAAGTLVGTVVARDDDVGGSLTYTLVSGNPGGSLFALHSTNGRLTVNNASLLNYEDFLEGIDMMVRVSDGTFENAAAVHVDVTDVNDPVKVFGANITIEENLALNALVGNPIEAKDPDTDQSIFFSIDPATNVGGAFSINICSGQLRVANPEMINYERFRDHKIVIKVIARDDGVPPSNDSAIVTVNLLDVNDRPVLNTTRFLAPENALAGEMVGYLPVFDEDNDTLAFIINSGDSQGFFRVAVDGLDPVTKHPLYALVMSDNVVGWGDGSGRQDIATPPSGPGGSLVLDYEDPARPSLKFKLQIVVYDDSPGALSSRSDVKFYDVDVGDRNDVPQAASTQIRSVFENSATGSVVGSVLSSTDEDTFVLSGVSGTRTDAHVWSWQSWFDHTKTPFQVDSNGRITVSLKAPSTGESWLDAERRSSYVLPLMVTDSGGAALTLMSEVTGGSDAAWRLRRAGRRLSATVGPQSRNVNVTVLIANVNERPIVLPGTLSVPEASPPGTVVGKLNISDPDPTDVTLTVTISEETNINSAFAIISNENGTTLTVARDVLDYETRNRYDLSVTATDADGLNHTATITVNILDRNDPPTFFSCPPVSLAPVDFRTFAGVSSVQAVLLTPTAADGINTFWFSQGITDSEGNAIGFGSDQARCQQACADAPLCDAWTLFLPTYRQLEWRGQCVGRTGFADVLVRVETGAADPATGSLPTKPTSAFHVFSGTKVRSCWRVEIDENTRPSNGRIGIPVNVSDYENYPFTVAITTSGSGIPTGSLAPATLFELTHIGAASTNPNGKSYVISIRSLAGLDFEAAPRHFIPLKAIDQPPGNTGEQPSSATTILAVIVRNVNERPLFPFATDGSGLASSAVTNRSVVELDEPATLIGLPVVCSDPDANTTLTYSLDDDGGGYYTVAPTTGQLSLSRKMDKEAPYTFALLLRCSDGALSSVAKVYVAVLDTNSRPVITGAGAARSIPENSVAGTAVSGTALGVVDPDVSDVHTWSIMAADPASALAAFAINSKTGALTVASGALEAPALYVMNYECDRDQPYAGCPSSHRQISLTVSVSDSGVGNLTAQATISISITNTQEAVTLPTSGSRGTKSGASPATLLLEVYENSLPGSPVFWAPVLSDPTAVGDVAPEADFFDDDRTPITFTWQPTGSTSIPPTVAQGSSFASSAMIVVASGNRSVVSTSSTSVQTSSPIDSLSASARDAFLNRYPIGQTPVFTIAAGAPSAVLSQFPDSLGRVFDYETAPTLSLTLQVQDAGGLPMVTMPVQVNVLNRLERPVFYASLPTAPAQSDPPGVVRVTLPEGSGGGVKVANLSTLAFDPDGDVLRYSLVTVRQVRASGEVVLEQPDSLTGQLAATFLVDSATGIVTLRQPAFGAASVLDFEQYVGYNLTVRISDRAQDTDAGILFIDATIVMTVADVNDVVIRSVVTPFGPLQTEGGEPVIITGTNIGFAYSLPPTMKPTIEVMYDCVPRPRSGDPDSLQTGPWVPANSGRDPFVSDCKYTAVNCEITSPGTEITCYSAPGAGRAHTWKVRITWAAATAAYATGWAASAFERHTNPSADSEDLPQLTSYAPPELREVAFPSAGLATKGGEWVTFLGRNLGPAGSIVSGEATSDFQPSADAAALGVAPRTLNVKPSVVPGSTTLGNGLSGCQVLNHTHARCLSGPGVGRGYFWVLAVEGQPSERLAQYQSAIASGAGGGRLPVQQMLTHYRQPVVTSMAPMSGAVSLSSLDTRGGARMLRLTGSDFGPVPMASPAGVTPLPNTGGVDPLLVVHARMSGPLFTLVVFCEIDPSKPHTDAICTVPAGVGRDFTWAIIVGGQTSAPSLGKTHYRSPTISRVFGTGAVASPTRGGARLLIEGDFFGPVSMPGMIGVSFVNWVVYGNRTLHSGGSNAPPSEVGAPVTGWVRATDCVVVTAHSTIQCSTGPGAGAGHSLQVSVGAQRSGLVHSAVSYGPPFITHTSGEASPAARTTGGQRVVLHGANLGPSITTLDFASYGPTGNEFIATACTMVEPHSAIECTTPEGAGKDLRFQVMVAGTVSASPRTQYAPPTLTGVRMEGSSGGFASALSGLSTRGGQRVEFSGVNLGASQAVSGFSYLDRVAIGTYILPASLCNGSSVTSLEHNRLTCVTPTGVGSNHMVDVTVGEQSQDAASISLSYAPPLLLALVLQPPARDVAGAPAGYGTPVPPRSYTGIPTTGGTLRIVARDLGRAIDGLSILVGVDAVSKQASPLTFAELPCEGSGGNSHASSVMVPAQWRPSFEAAFPIPADPAAIADAGPYPRGTAFPVTAFARGLYCADILIPAGDGSARPVWAESGGQVSNVLSWSYAPPFIRDLVVIEDPLDSRHRVVILKGGDFGLARFGKVYVGACARNATSTAILASRADGGAIVLADWALEAVGRSQLVGEETETDVVRVNCGGDATRPVVTLVECLIDGEGIGAGRTAWSHTEVRCRIPRIRQMDGDDLGAGAGPLKSGFVVAVGGVDKVPTRVHTYSESSPVVDSYDPKESPSAGQTVITVAGRYLSGWPNREAIGVDIRNDSVAYLADSTDPAAWGVCAVVANSYRELRDDGSECTPSDSAASLCIPRTEQRARLQCLAPPGAGSVASAALRARRFEQVSEEVPFAYQAPTLVRLSGRPSTGAGGWSTKGGPQVILEGTDFGVVPVVQMHSSLTGGWQNVPASDVTLTDTVSHGTLRFTLPEGSGVQRAIRVIAGDQTSSTLTLDYDPPRIDTTCTLPQRLAGDTRGGTIITLCGMGFGTSQFADVNPSVSAVANMSTRSFVEIGGRRIPVMSWNHTYIVFRMPPGQGMDLEILVTADGQRSDKLPPGPAPPILPALRFTYEQPELDRVIPLSGPTSALDSAGDPMEIRLEGRNFGTAPKLFFGGAEIPLLEASHTLVRARIPPGQGASKVVLDAGAQTFESIPLFQYDPPVATLLLAASAGRTDACSKLEDVRLWRTRTGTLPAGADTRRLCCSPQTIRIRGTSFGVKKPRVILSPPTSIPQGAAATAGLQMSALGRVLDKTCAELVQAVEDSWKGRAFMNQTGCVPYDPCIVTWTHSEIIVRMPPGQGSGISISVQVDDLQDDVLPEGAPFRNTSVPGGFSYNLPVIQQVESSPFDGLGAIVTMRGLNLGYDDALLRSFAYGDVDAPLPFADLQAKAAAERAKREAAGESLIPSTSHIDINVALEGWTDLGNASWHHHRRALQSATIPPASERSTEALTVLNVLISGVPCDALEWARDSQAGDPKGAPPYLRCRLERVPVGVQNVTVTIAGVTQEHLAVVDALAESTCFEGAYGAVGELCLPCPDGALCPGSPIEPAALPGYWREELDPSDPFYDRLCPLERRDRVSCPLVTGCVPSSACGFNNTCTLGYEGIRCSQCLRGKYYRVNGECIECPQNPELILAAFLVGVVFVCIGAYEMNRRQLNLAFLAVGIDYFQVLSLFSNVKVKWPAFLKEIFRILSVFNLNLDLTAPECWAEGITFSARWYATIAMPLGATFMIALVWVSSALWTRFIKCQKLTTMDDSTNSLISAITTIYYVSYLLLARATVDVLACAPSVPPDPRGRTFMESTAIPCFEPGGEHLSMFPFAVTALAGYNFALPAVIFWFLYQNRAFIKEDQYLRAMDTGDSPSTNPNTLQLRKRWMRLYYLFKPQYWWYIEVIFVRKLGLAFAALAFRSAPSLQLAVALLVTFYSFVLTVRLRPYLCWGESKAVLAEHEHLAASGSPLHSKINMTLRSVRSALRGKDVHRHGNALWRSAVGGDATPTSRGKSKDVAVKSAKDLKGAAGLLGKTGATGSSSTSLAAQQLWRELRRQSLHSNLNTVDSVLMGCASMVTLGGLLYEAGAFSERDASADVLLVTIILIIVMVSGTLFFFVTSGIELMAEMRPGTCLKPKIRKQARLDAKALSKQARTFSFMDTPLKSAQTASSDAVTPVASPKPSPRSPRRPAPGYCSRLIGCVGRLFWCCPCGAVPVDDPNTSLIRHSPRKGKMIRVGDDHHSPGSIGGVNPLMTHGAGAGMQLTGVGVNQAMASELERQQEEAEKARAEALRSENLVSEKLPDDAPDREVVHAWLKRFHELQEEASSLGADLRDLHRIGDTMDPEMEAALSRIADRRRRTSSGSGSDSKAAVLRAQKAMEEKRREKRGSRFGGVNPLLAGATGRARAPSGGRGAVNPAIANPMFAAAATGRGRGRAIGGRAGSGSAGDSGSDLT